TEVRTDAGALVSRVVSHAERDAFGRPTRVLVNGEELASYGYQNEGYLDFATFSARHANEEIVTFQRDPLTRRHTGHNLATTTWTSATTTRLDARGLIGREAFDIGTARRERAYGYDAAGQLTSTSDGASPASDATADETYAYDAAGLQTTRTKAGVVTAFTRSGATLTAGEHTYTFDELGRVVAKDDVELAYGPRGHVREARNAQKTWAYLYDEQGLRIAKLEGGVVTQAFPKDGSFLDAAHGLVEPLHVGGVLVGTLHHGAAGTAEATRFEPIAADLRGTRLSNRDGSPVFASPWGERDGGTHPDLAEAVDYATKGWDRDLGVVRMGVRDYDPALGRFLQPDALYFENLEKCAESPLDCNLYAYAKNNPLLFVDPTGFEGEQLSVFQKAGHVAAGIAYGTTQAFTTGGLLLNPPGQTRYFEMGQAAGGADGAYDSNGRKVGAGNGLASGLAHFEVA
ncbi:hypothetical protein EON77_10800, partial [bacterium]